MGKYILELKDIKKDYKLADNVVPALKGVSMAFRHNEFVSILGPSGCGKTTMLNIIGGLDQYTSGDLIIKGQSTKKFKGGDWDTYRNHSIGFVFQSYNLIPHLSVLGNVELALTLAGISSKERKQRAMAVLERVGLKNECKKRPNQLSGGQMQRVAIARALVNNPEILLADEPTGALDSKTSVQIMELIKEISKERLVIMVTHNTELAEKYSSRIIKLLDGKVIDDSNPPSENDDALERIIGTLPQNAQNLQKNDKKAFKKKKSSMSVFTAFMLSLKNLITKKGRTILTSVAGSIGIIGVALVLAISNGFTNYINKMQTDTLGGYPIAVSTVAIDYSSLSSFMGESNKVGTSEEEGSFGVYNPSTIIAKMGNYNFISDKFVKYINDYIEEDNKKGDRKSLSSVQFTYATNLKVLTEGSEGIIFVDTKPTTSSIYGTSSSLFYEGLSDKDFVLSNYDIVEGKYPENKNEVLLVLNSTGALSTDMLTKLGIAVSVNSEGEYERILYSDVIGKTYKVISNDTYYTPVYDSEGNVTEFSTLAKADYQTAFDGASETLSICGVMKPRKDIVVEVFDAGIMYLPELATSYQQDCKNSLIVQKSIDDGKFYVPFTVDISELKGFGLGIQNFNTPAEIVGFVKSSFDIDMTAEEATNLGLQMVGASTIPTGIYLYPKNFDGKAEVLKLIDDWNASENGAHNKIVYTDATEVLTGTLGELINIISYVLIAFAAISLLVSSIMIGIITYVSVVERTKEIGVLRSIGARKRDIARVFNAETFIIGLFAGLIGVVLTYILCFPVNAIIAKVSGGLKNIAVLKFGHALILIAVSFVLTLISGLIPARIASKKDPVVALRSE
mgnify:FL=1